jgi:pilus assembly protein CpaB
MSRVRDRIDRMRGHLAAHRGAWMALGAVGFGALAVVGAHNYIAERLAQETARLQPRQEGVEVVVAKRALRRGEPVDAQTMAVRSIPRAFAPSGAVMPEGFESVAGGRLLVAMQAGEPLMPTAIAAADRGAISTRVRPGIRAMTIAVDEVNSLSGLLQPGDRIDLLLSVRPASVGGGVGPELTRTVLQGVTVLATGRQSRAFPNEEPAAARAYTAITVEVDPQQAQKLVVAQRSGKLTAVLRNPEDLEPVADRPLDVNTLLGLAPVPIPVPPPVARPAASVVEVIVGGRGSAAATTVTTPPDPTPPASPGGVAARADRSRVLDPGAPDAALPADRPWPIGSTAPEVPLYR